MGHRHSHGDSPDWRQSRHGGCSQPPVCRPSGAQRCHQGARAWQFRRPERQLRVEFRGWVAVGDGEARQLWLPNSFSGAKLSGSPGAVFACGGVSQEVPAPARCRAPLGKPAAHPGPSTCCSAAGHLPQAARSEDGAPGRRPFVRFLLSLPGAHGPLLTSRNTEKSLAPLGRPGARPSWVTSAWPGSQPCELVHVLEIPSSCGHSWRAVFRE